MHIYTYLQIFICKICKRHFLVNSALLHDWPICLLRGRQPWGTFHCLCYIIFYFVRQHLRKNTTKKPKGKEVHSHTNTLCGGTLIMPLIFRFNKRELVFTAPKKWVDAFRHICAHIPWTILSRGMMSRLNICEWRK